MRTPRPPSLRKCRLLVNEWPINSGNVRRCFLHPAAVGVNIGGWHDFRHILTRMMRRAGVNAVVVSGTLGHKKVKLAAEVYDRASSTDIPGAPRGRQTVAINRATK